MVLLILFLIFPFTLVSSEEFPDEEKMITIPPNIESVLSTGFWEEKNKKGHYRFIILRGGFEHVTARLYIQWMQHNVQKNNSEIIATSKVTELSWPYNFELPKCLVKPSCSNLEGDAVNVYNSSKLRYSLKLTGVGKYKFSKLD